MPLETCTPLIYVRVRSRVREAEEVRRSRHVRAQISIIRTWADQTDRELTEAVVVAGTRAGYRPERDTRLQRAVKAALADKRPLVMDDALRFTDGCDEDDAFGIMRSLIELRAPIFSIRHRSLLTRIDAGIINGEVFLRTVEYRERRERAERAAAVPDHMQPAPSTKARRAAARVRGRIADWTARRLVQDIERVRAALSAEKRNSRSAIARALNDAEIAPPSGRGKWQGTTVQRVLDRTGRSLDR